MTEVWVNGQFAAKHVNPYTSFTVEITKQVKEGENVISLHTDSRMKPNSRWYVGAGLYRPVWLHIAEQVSVKPHGVRITTKELNENKAVLDVEIELAQTACGTESIKVENAVDDVVSIKVEVLDDIDSQVASVSTELHTAETGVKKEVHTGMKTEVHTGAKTGQQKISLEIPVSDITPWSPEHPTLYTAKITVTPTSALEEEKAIGADETVREEKKAVTVADVYEETFGIRTVSVNPQEGFLLNGVPMKLKGGCVHHDLGILGAADHEAAEYRRVKLLKESGFNALRLSHNPYGPAIF